MFNENQSNPTTDSEGLETDEKELFRLQIDEWLEMCLDHMFSNLLEDDLTETDESEEPLGE